MISYMYWAIESNPNSNYKHLFRFCLLPSEEMSVKFSVC